MLDDRLIDRWLGRGTQFFRAITRNSNIRTGLQARGLSAEELVGGWELYSNVVGVRRMAELVTAAPVANNAADAMSELDSWDAPALSTTQAVLEHRTPNAAHFLLGQLSAGEGPEAVVTAGHFVDRWDQLRQGKAAGVPPSEAEQAVQLLSARRIIDSDIAAHLRRLIQTAQTGALASAPEPAGPGLDAATFERYRSWLHEWREVARATFTRRDYRITLGLATRRTSASGEEEVIEDVDPPVSDETNTIAA